jgi:hypothetical protein
MVAGGTGDDRGVAPGSYRSNDVEAAGTSGARSGSRGRRRSAQSPATSSVNGRSSEMVNNYTGTPTTNRRGGCRSRLMAAEAPGARRQSDTRRKKR